MSGLLDWPRYSRWTWIVAILLFLLLVLLWVVGHGPGRAGACCGSPPAVVAPAPMPTQAPGALAFEPKDGKLVLDGVVQDQATRARLLKMAIDAYGAADVIDRMTIDASKSSTPCADKGGALLVALESAPAIGVACAGDQVTLTGSVWSDADKSARGQWAHDFFGANTQIVNRIEVAAPVARAGDVRCGDKISAAVTFATGSASIDAQGRALLGAIAACLKNGHYEVAGYTDNVGSAAGNARLSKARADAVRTYLIGKGVAGERLTATGYGADHPIADNTTAEGRAKNRRIEFTKK